MVCFWLYLCYLVLLLSLQNLFKNLNHSSIPWLFIDEVGQALPQMATGAIWRSNGRNRRRSTQIEPVNTLPDTFTYFIAEKYGLNQEDLQVFQSVQNVADQGNEYGTMMGETWVGTPLKVHRRCIDPMFSIANPIAYDNVMVKATLSRQKSPHYYLKLVLHMSKVR